jgi:WD40 repeat protein
MSSVHCAGPVLCGWCTIWQALPLAGTMLLLLRSAACANCAKLTRHTHTHTAHHSFQVATGRMLKMWEGHYKGVTALAWTTDDMFLLSGGEDALLHLWSLARYCSTQVLHTLPGDTAPRGLTPSITSGTAFSMTTTHRARTRLLSDPSTHGTSTRCPSPPSSVASAVCGDAF